MKRWSLPLRFSAIATLIAILALPAVALAHEQRTIGNGKYDVEVGWDKEPPLVNQPNAATIRIYQAGTQNPVEGVEHTLKVQIAFGGGQPKEFPLAAVEDQKGYYVADLIPTKAGSYIFTFVGDIEGTAVNERFESGPGRFDDVTSADAIQFPQVVPDPVTVAGQVTAAQDEASSARSLAMAGLAVGFVGLVAAGTSLALRRPTR